MDGLFDAGAAIIASTVQSCAQSQPAARAESLRITRYMAKLGLLLTEFSLLPDPEELRGSKSVFLAVDAAISALRQAEQLVAQCVNTPPSSIWPLEDAVEFDSVAAELRSAASGLAALGSRLPRDVQEDAAHVYRQLMLLTFSEADLSETEGQELEAVQQHNAGATAGPAAGGPALEPSAAAPAPPAGAAPPAAPPAQFTDPAVAVHSGAVAASQAAAASASSPPAAAAAAAADALDRRALQSAAAVATEAAAEVLSADGDGEAALVEAAEPAGGGQLLSDIVAEAAAGAGEGVVVTLDGETALPPLSPAKGAVPARGASPLPPDPFEMSRDTSAELGSTTLRELESFQRGQDVLAVADEVQQQLEGTPDCLSLREQVGTAGAGAGAGGQALAALKQLRDYESAMGSGEEVEAAGAAEEGRVPEGGAALPVSVAAAGGGAQPVPMHKSRSQQAAAVLAQNLEELRTA